MVEQAMAQTQVLLSVVAVAEELALPVRILRARHHQLLILWAAMAAPALNGQHHQGNITVEVVAAPAAPA
jgi:hypothetical protein